MKSATLFQLTPRIKVDQAQVSTLSFGRISQHYRNLIDSTNFRLDNSRFYYEKKNDRNDFIAVENSVVLTIFTR